jgi:hypothetical protein
MNTTLAVLIVFGCLVAVVLLGRTFRRLLPEDHLTADSRDTIKLAMGLVATMTALVLGLLVSSVKGAYDTKRPCSTRCASSQNDGLRSQSPPGDYCSTRNAFQANS